MYAKHKLVFGVLCALTISSPAFALEAIAPLESEGTIDLSASQKAEDLSSEVPAPETFEAWLSSLEPTTAVQANTVTAQGINPAPSNLPEFNYGYVGLGLGVGIPNNASADDVSIRLGNRSTRGSVEQNLDLGFSGELAAGYQFKQGRLELAVGYGDIGGSGGTIYTTFQNRGIALPYDSSVSADYVSILVNGYYDLSTGTKWRPYIGAGVGYVHVSVGDIAFDTQLGRVEVVKGGSAGTFGYQGKLGLSYEVVPKGNLFGEVGYLGSAGYQGYSALGVWRFALGWRQGF